MVASIINVYTRETSSFTFRAQEKKQRERETDEKVHLIFSLATRKHSPTLVKQVMQEYFDRSPVIFFISSLLKHIERHEEDEEEDLFAGACVSPRKRERDWVEKATSNRTRSNSKRGKKVEKRTRDSIGECYFCFSRAICWKVTWAKETSNFVDICLSRVVCCWFLVFAPSTLQGYVFWGRRNLMQVQGTHRHTHRDTEIRSGWMCASSTTLVNRSREEEGGR